MIDEIEAGTFKVDWFRKIFMSDEELEVLNDIKDILYVCYAWK